MLLYQCSLGSSLLGPRSLPSVMIQCRGAPPPRLVAFALAFARAARRLKAALGSEVRRLHDAKLYVGARGGARPSAIRGRPRGRRPAGKAHDLFTRPSSGGKARARRPAVPQP